MDLSSMDTYQELQEEKELLDKLIHYLRNNNKKLAQAEHDYRLALSKKILELHTRGYVGEIKGETIDTDSVAWSSCSLLARGLPEVAAMRLDRDIKKGEKNATQEKIYQTKRNMDILSNELNQIAKGE